MSPRYLDGPPLVPPSRDQQEQDEALVERMAEARRGSDAAKAITEQLVGEMSAGVPGVLRDPGTLISDPQAIADEAMRQENELITSLHTRPLTVQDNVLTQRAKINAQREANRRALEEAPQYDSETERIVHDDSITDEEADEQLDALDHSYLETGEYDAYLQVDDNPDTVTAEDQAAYDAYHEAQSALSANYDQEASDGEPEPQQPASPE